uniref:cell envelope integrity protein TolA n=1 Tax=Phaeovulum sp. TaxID=2934796 RepID=UPI00356162D3
PLTAGELGNLRSAISACWTVGAASTETLRSIVTVGITMTPGGEVESVRRISADSPSDAAANTAYDIARRTILRCIGNAALPPEKYETWREIEMVFDYNGMRLR